jgi:hypothetical protein
MYSIVGIIMNESSVCFRGWKREIAFRPHKVPYYKDDVEKIALTFFNSHIIAII